jgi:hypothetical protein
MSLIRRAVAAALGVALVAAVPALAAQSPERAQLIIGAYGGQYTHFANLTNRGPNADFRPGYNLGVTVGFQLSPVVSLHTDVTFARSRARGATPFAGALVDRVFFGEHVELAADMGSGVKWYGFAGGGMVRVQGADQVYDAFWKPAGMAGVGMFINVPRSNVDFMVEGKVLGYEFDRRGSTDPVGRDVGAGTGLQDWAPVNDRTVEDGGRRWRLVR